MTTDDHTFVLSLGGSLVVPNGGIDIEYLTKFNEFIRNQISSKLGRFFIVVGGGATTRHYQKAAQEILKHEIVHEDLDWIGIHATRLNAHLIRIIFRDIAHSHVLKHFEIIRKTTEPVVVAAGWKPGWSTDYCAITICEDYNIHNIINLTNVDQVYDKDPKKFPDAKPLGEITWDKYREMVGSDWTPGMNAPFDPIASKLAAEIGVTVKIVNGKNLDNLGKALDGQKFFGTTISA